MKLQLQLEELWQEQFFVFHQQEENIQNAKNLIDSIYQSVSSQNFM